jgi:hypothetical protein
LGVWAFGRLGVWAFGRLGVWAFGRLGVKYFAPRHNFAEKQIKPLRFQHFFPFAADSL